jgi:uncharacterized protein YprB with RNaseH-like and TPR domain|tara:strand:- start:289 stop:492 length:204 start_codon:yes stop_codon:yes gene_type:complete
MITIKKEEEYLEFCTNFSDYCAEVRRIKLQLLKELGHYPTVQETHDIIYKAETLANQRKYPKINKSF